MPDIWVTKLPNGSLVAQDGSGIDYLKKIRAGNPLLVRIKQPRNPKFHRKIMSLLSWAYENVELPEAEYKGVKVKASFDRFRHDLVVMAGFFDAVANIKGEVRAQAHSLSYDNCPEDKAERIYSALLDVIADRLFHGNYTAEELDELTEQWMAYA